MNRLNRTERKVLKFLTQDPRTRDSDPLLIALFWYDEVQEHFNSGTFLHNADSMTATKFLDRLSKGFYTSAESIRRYRQMLQEHHEYLRGKSYIVRQRRQVREVQASLGYRRTRTK